MITNVKALPANPSLEQYRKQAKDLVKAWKSGDFEAAERVRRFHPRICRASPSTAVRFNLADAQLTTAREHGFESWPKFVKHLEALARESSPVSQFELAADAIASGNAAALERLLRENPALVHSRSMRVHRGTLLHYIGANGVEDYRQKTPKNAVVILNILLKAGAKVDAVAAMYHEDTTLGLVATSIHPVLAGVQEALMATLLTAGAVVDSGMVNACLRNGRGKAAELLASRVAHLDLEGAAGVGRLDLVSTYFSDRGALTANATRAQMQAGLNWASEYGRDRVIEFLLAKGADPGAADQFSMTALHWAAVGGQPQAARILLAHYAPLEAKSGYGSTALGQAVWSALHDQTGIDYVPVVETLLAAGADGTAVRIPTGHAGIDRALRRRGAVDG